jgi:hypothetical protein
MGRLKQLRCHCRDLKIRTKLAERVKNNLMKMSRRDSRIYLFLKGRMLYVLSLTLQKTATTLARETVQKLLVSLY